MLGQVEQVGCVREIQIAVRVESTAEFVGMILKIGFHRKLCDELIFTSGMVGRSLSPEPLCPFFSRAIRHHAELSRQALSGDGWIAWVIVTLQPLGVRTNHFPLQRPHRDRKWQRTRCRRNRNIPARRVRVADTIGKPTHAAHRTTNDGVYRFNTEMLDDQVCRVSNIFKGQHRKRQPVTFTGFRVDGCGSCRSETAPQ